MNIIRLHQRPAATTYEIVDHLHDRHAVGVTGDRIAATVSDWLAELGVHSPLAEELAAAVRRGDWPATHDIGDKLSVDVMVAA